MKPQRDAKSRRGRNTGRVERKLDPNGDDSLKSLKINTFVRDTRHFNWIYLFSNSQSVCFRFSINDRREIIKAPKNNINNKRWRSNAITKATLRTVLLLLLF